MYAAAQKQSPPDQSKERFCSLFSNWGGFGSSKQTSPNQQTPTEVAFASSTTKPSLFKKHLPEKNPKPTYGEHLGDPDKRWSNEESVADNDDDITLGDDDLKTKKDENITNETSKQKGDDTEEKYGNDLAKAIWAELDKSDLLTSFEDNTSKDSNQNLGDKLTITSVKDENEQTDSVSENNDVNPTSMDSVPIVSATSNNSTSPNDDGSNSGSSSSSSNTSSSNNSSSSSTDDDNTTIATNTNFSNKN